VKNTLLIAASTLKEYAVGNTPQERFLNLMKPEHLAQTDWCLKDDGEQFQACLAALIMSYEKGTPEYEQVSVEISFIAALGRALESRNPELFKALGGRESPPLGLVTLWHSRPGYQPGQGKYESGR
jgi:hypothetical protein